MYLKSAPQEVKPSTVLTSSLSPDWESKSLAYRDEYSQGVGWDCWMLAKKPEHNGFTLAESGISGSAAAMAADARLSGTPGMENFIFKADLSLTGNEYHIGIKIFEVIEQAAQKKIGEYEGKLDALVTSLGENLATPKDIYIAKEVYTKLALDKKLPENAALLKEQLQQKEAEAVKGYITSKESTFSKQPYTLEPGEYRPHQKGQYGGAARKVLLENYDKEVIALVKKGLEVDGKASLLAEQKQLTV